MSSTSSARGARAGTVRVALVAAVAGAGLLASTGTAAAAKDATVVPLLDCVVGNDDGTWTAVFGYRNESDSPVTIPPGPRNKVTPAGGDVSLPVTFRPGTHRGAFTVTVDRGAGPMWHLDGTNLAARRDAAPACPSSTELPAEGNGLGAVLGLAGAGAVGAVLVHRAGRRARSLPAGGGDDA